ncbi:unnamed protein product [Anisakis simplex]|uniref:C2 domain-containing protein n=1 Tax=Anisakis simplex TaxID=6269 RepID=A0A0M3K3F7_ANISI|nr:unnamed protein product [Anisakis simplex]
MAESAVQFLERRRSSEQSIGSLQPDLYRRRGSVITHQSMAGHASVARIQLKICYDFVKSDFIIALLQVSEIDDLEEYYFVISINESNQRETSRMRATSQFNPQLFKFAICHEDVLDQSLTVQLFGSKRIDRRLPYFKAYFILFIEGSPANLIGCSTIELSSIDPSDDIFLWMTIDAYETLTNLGEILIGLQYLSCAERLTVTVYEARGLKCDSIPDGCVRVNLLQEGKLRKKRKTAVRRDESPSWNEAFSFNVPHGSIAT